MGSTLRDEVRQEPINYGWETIKTCRKEDIVRKRKIYATQSFENKRQRLSDGEEGEKETIALDTADNEESPCKAQLVMD